MVVVLNNQVEDKADQVVVNLEDPLEEEVAVVIFVLQKAEVIEDQIVQVIEMGVQKEGQDQTDQEDIEDVNSIQF
jgi:hypothetical protein